MDRLAGSTEGHFPWHLEVIARDVCQGNLIDAQELGQQLSVQPVGLAAALIRLSPGARAGGRALHGPGDAELLHLPVQRGTPDPQADRGPLRATHCEPVCLPAIVPVA